MIVIRVGLVVPLVAVIGTAFATYTVLEGRRPRVDSAPFSPPPRSDRERVVAGSGIVEASSENIAVGTHLSGIIAAVSVAVGDQVRAGQPLLVIDDRQQRAAVDARSAAVARSRAVLERLRAEPRPETIPASEARVREAEALLADARERLDSLTRLADGQAASPDEVRRARRTLEASEARLALATADLDLLRAGAWREDVVVAEAQLAEAESALQEAQVDLERHTVRAPIDGEVLDIDVRPGEFAAAGPAGVPGSAGASATPALVVLGRTDTLHVRVDVDENDAWRVRAGAPAVASLRGNATIKAALEFVRIEPLVVPKRSLTGSSLERIDTRVLQVIYRLDATELPAYVGQQVDVFIEAASGASTP